MNPEKKNLFPRDRNRSGQTVPLPNPSPDAYLQRATTY